MTESKQKPGGPDLGKGIALTQVTDGALLLGHAQGEPVLLARCQGELYAIGARCTHYGALLSDGLLVGATVRCPWHHACFSLRDGTALRGPALDPVDCWRVTQENGRVYVGEKLARKTQKTIPLRTDTPKAVVIVGGGAAGNAAAETLRREGYSGRITLLSADSSRPYDRPKLSKGFLAGTAAAESNPLHPPAFYSQHHIELMLNSSVTTLDARHRTLRLVNGNRIAYDALLLATGAEPARLETPGGTLRHVHYLRTLADSRALVAKVLASQRAVVIGAGFIGLEVAASLRARNIEVHVVAPETVPMERMLGPALGKFIRALHERHGVTFHLGTTAIAIDKQSVHLISGAKLQADLVVVGIGVRPVTALAEPAGLAIDRGIMVNDYLETNIPGIFAAGDIARWPYRLTGEHIRVEHWALAERQGQTAARNILGRRERFDAVPFFWTEQYDFGLAYVGHAEGWDHAEFDGQLDATTQDCTITYRRAGEKLAVAVVHRDLEGLRAELEFETLIATTARQHFADTLRRIRDAN